MLETSSCGIGGEIVTDVAFVVVHVIVLNCPTVIVAGDAASVAVGFGGGGGGGGGGGVVLDPPPAHEVKENAKNNSPINPEKRVNDLLTGPFPYC